MAVIARVGKERSAWAIVRRVIAKAWEGEDTSNTEQPPDVLYGESILSVNNAGTGTNGLIKSAANAAATADSTILTNGAEIPTGKVLNIVDAAGLTYSAGVTVAPGTAGGAVTIGNAAGTGTITLGSSSAAETVAIADGAGAPTVNIANTSTAGATISVAGAATATGNTDTVNIATGNAAGTGAKKVNIATGVPNTSGNNQVVIGGGAKTALTFNAVVTSYQATNFIATESGLNNALVASLTDAGGNNVTVAAGLRIALKIAHTLQAGANTLNLNGHGTDSIKSHNNVANNIGTAYAANSIVDLMFDGTQWQDMSQ